MQNIEKVLDRGEKLELLVDKTENLRYQADQFQKGGKALRNKMWWQNVKMKLLVFLIVAIVVVVIFCFACVRAPSTRVPTLWKVPPRAADARARRPPARSFRAEETAWTRRRRRDKTLRALASRRRDALCRVPCRRRRAPTSLRAHAAFLPPPPAPLRCAAGQRTVWIV